MHRKGGLGRTEHDVETVLDELYTTAPPDFVTRREELSAAAKSAGRAEDARRIHAARRPTLAAWAANLLLRSRPEESERFLELGRALRAAYQALDAEGIKELSERRRSIVSALSQQAARQAREAGHRLSDAAQEDVASTLRAVLADQGAADQWATGRLQSALTPPSTFPSDSAPASAAPRKPNRPAAAPPSPRGRTPTRTKDELADRRLRQEELARARRAAETAERRLREQRAAQADADTSLQRARDRHCQARQQVSAAEQQLQQAHERLQRAEQEQREAEEVREAAADALALAEQEAHEADQEVERLTAPAE